MMYWRKDGEEHHEDVDHGEILPNHDGSFQISVDLILSSVAPEDWRRYDCVFHLSGVEDDIVTKLDKAQIRTNWVSPSEFPAAGVTGVVVGLLLLLALCIAGLFIWRRNNNGNTEKNVQSCRGKVCSIKQVFSHTDEPMVGSPFICSDL
ncbi:BOLA class I histocompatibility antigen, alpha chain BL3-7-like isoform X2 [Anarrhichthys ocellatus]|uniref:BOLA class I histocompatibility antigen, alpha chain BL3-7-like isoform X2 n=1 Tax=Anarrhichthys ocellatus TaxID=433405 RepID=UPI0012EDEB36|nr:BOLA class I histocompatibility antigen, alpha chain BL3-7-like isoform X2 [Anarrhichthys ocellatus]